MGDRKEGPESTGWLLSVWPGQSPRRPSPALSTRSGAHSPNGCCCPAEDCVRPCVLRPPRRGPHYLRRLRPVPDCGSAPMREDAWAFAPSQTPEERGGQPLRSSPPQGPPRLPPRSLKEMEASLCISGIKHAGPFPGAHLLAESRKLGFSEKDLQAKSRGLCIHLDDPVLSAAGLLS